MSFSQVWEKPITLTNPRICQLAGGVAVLGADGEAGYGIDVYSTTGARLINYRDTDPPLPLDGLFDTIPFNGGMVLLGGAGLVDHTGNVNLVDVVAIFVQASGTAITFGTPVSIGNLRSWDGTGEAFATSFSATLDLHAQVLSYDMALVSDGTTLKAVIGGIEATGGGNPALRPVHLDVVTLTMSGADMVVADHNSYVSTLPDPSDSGAVDAYSLAYVAHFGNRAAGARLLIDGTVEYVSQQGTRYRATIGGVVLAPGDGPVGTIDNTGTPAPVVDDVSNFGIVKHYDYASAS